MSLLIRFSPPTTSSLPFFRYQKSMSRTDDADEEGAEGSDDAFLSDYEAYVDPGPEPELSSAYEVISVPLHKHKIIDNEDAEGKDDDDREEDNLEDSNRMHVELSLIHI